MVAALTLPFFGLRCSTAYRLVILSRPLAPAGASVLKPLCGVGPRSYENLLSFASSAKNARCIAAT